MRESDLSLTKELKESGFEQHQAEQLLKIMDKKMTSEFATKHEIELNFLNMQNYIELRFEKMQNYMDRRFEKMQHEMDHRFEKMQNEMDRRFEKMQNEMDRRFADVNARIDKLETKMGIYGTIAVGIIIAAIKI